MNPINSVIGVFLLAFGSAVSATPLPQQPHIYVEGTAEIEVVPDQMIISVGLTSENMDVELAKEDVDKRSTKLLQTLKSQTIDAEDIGTTALQITPVYDYVDGRQVPRGSRVYRQVEVTLTDLENYADLMQALMDAKVSNTVNTSLTVADDKTVGDQALIAALADAKARAAALVESTGQKLGAVYSISEFDMRREESYQLVPNREVFNASAGDMVAMENKRAREPFEPGVIRATAKIYVVYLIKQSKRE